MADQDPDGVQEDGQYTWLKHPFGRSFDLISRTYGWTDDQILDLTLGRMRYVRAMIMDRQVDEREQQWELAEVVTQTLVAHIRLAGGDSKGGVVARAIQLFKRRGKSKERELPELDQIAARMGGAPGSLQRGLQQGQLIDPDLVSRAYGGGK